MTKQVNGGLKDIFSTILQESQVNQRTATSTPRIVVHGDGNVIAPGGTVHYVQAPAAAKVRPRVQPGRGQQ